MRTAPQTDDRAQNVHAALHTLRAMVEAVLRKRAQPLLDRADALDEPLPPPIDYDAEVEAIANGDDEAIDRIIAAEQAESDAMRAGQIREEAARLARAKAAAVLNTEAQAIGDIQTNVHAALRLCEQRVSVTLAGRAPDVIDRHLEATVERIGQQVMRLGEQYGCSAEAKQVHDDIAELAREAQQVRRFA
jgi:hypothetical protein